MTLLAEFVDILEEVSSTSSKLKKIEILAEYMRSVDTGDIGSVALYLSGSVLPDSDQRTLDISWNTFKEALHQVFDFTDEEFSENYEGDIGEAILKIMNASSGPIQNSLISTNLRVEDFREAIDRIAGSEGYGSRKQKISILAGLLNLASPEEARYLTALILGDLRTGVSKGLVIEAIAASFSMPADEIRRAWGACGNLGHVAQVASNRNLDQIRSITVSLFRPAKPMLATSIDDLSEMVGAISKYALEMKYDGARVQIHKKGEDIRIFSRGLTEVTDSLPEIVDIIQHYVKPMNVILDGEVVATDTSGKPYPFQVVMRRFGRKRDIEQSEKAIKLALHVFDILLLENKPLLNEEYQERRAILSKTVEEAIRGKRIEPKSIEEARKYFRRSKEEGHEGIMIKRLDSEYVFGRWGKRWFKLKHTLDTMDLVIVAAEWGHGRRSNWLSDFHLAVRDEGAFVRVGKTFKGLTDREFEYITQRLLSLKISEERNIVHVKPQIVVEVTVSEIQKSSTYSSGLALRFARIKAIREDKPVDDAMTLRDLESIYEKQFRYKARRV
jgi:DNA ligase-1